MLVLTLVTQWPGYRPISRQVNVRQETSARDAIYKSKLAYHIAKAVESMFEVRNCNHRHSCVCRVTLVLKELSNLTSADTQWAIVDTGIRFEEIELISLRRVSKGSWQPVFHYVTRSSAR